ncbi:MAG: ABC transporter permease [Gemmatimonadota bacterium]|nr:ABC transporter permease [Gemmatimonadota bacterium]
MTIERRQKIEEALLPPIVAILIAFVAGDILMLSFNQSPLVVWRLLLEGTWGNAYGFGQVLYKATTLSFTGMAVAFAYRAGLFNIGGEGQLAAGGLAAALVGFGLPAGFPAIIAIILGCIGAAAAGGIVGAVPGYLRVRFGAHEVITTIMLNFVVLALLNWFIATKLRVPETLHTPEIHAGGIPRLSALLPAFHGSAANFSVLIALLGAGAMWYYMFRMRGGYELRAVGLQPDAAEYGGIAVRGVLFRAMTISGVIAGLGGINFVLGYKHYYEDGFAGGTGFLGIAVALVGRNNPFGILVAALFFATLSQGGLAVNAFVPKQMVDVLQGVVIIAIAASVPEVRRVLLGSRRPGPVVPDAASALPPAPV